MSEYYLTTSGVKCVSFLYATVIICWLNACRTMFSSLVR